MVVLSAGADLQLLSPLYQLFFPGWVQYCPCPALVCSWRRHNKNKPWNSRPFHARRSSGLCGRDREGEGGDNGAFRYSQNKKRKEPWHGFQCQRRKRFQCSCFHRGRTWSCSQPNRRLRLVQLIIGYGRGGQGKDNGERNGWNQEINSDINVLIRRGNYATIKAFATDVFTYPG